MDAKIAFWAAFFFGYTLNAITGFAGNLFVMPVGMSTLGLQESIAALNVAGGLASGILGIQGWRSVDWRELVRMVVVMLAFMLVGVWIDSMVSLDILKKIFAVFVLVVGLKNLLMPNRRRPPQWLLWVFLAVAGIIQGMFVCGGAMLVVYATYKLTDKETFRATLGMNWLILNAVYAVYQWHMGYMTTEVGVVIAGCIPLMIIATLIGNVINRHMSQEGFLKFCYIMLVVIGIVTFVS